MRKRGFTLIELLVVIAIIGVLAAILLPNIVDALKSGAKTKDLNNLKGLVDAYITGLTHQKTPPRSKGHRFWLALYVGDNDDQVGGLKIKDAFCNSGEAGLLVCPEDRGAKSKDEISNAIDEMKEVGTSGCDQLPEEDILFTSYAGPKRKRYFSESKIVGATGSRGGVGFFEDGFHIVRGNHSVEFKSYKGLTEKFPEDWDGEEDEPNWESKLLKTLINIEDSSN